MDMDVDEVFGSEDKIQAFLDTKLQEIRLENQNLETVLRERQQELLTQTPKPQARLEIKTKWKKLINCYYVFGFKAICSESFQDIQIVLNCSEDCDFPYETQAFCASEGGGEVICGSLKKSNCFKEGKAYVTLSFPMLEFLTQPQAKVIGYFLANVSSKNHPISAPFPELSIDVNDATNLHNNFCLRDQSLDNILAIVACYQQTDLIMTLPDEWTTPLSSTFEINCSLSFVPVLLNEGFYVANRISEVFDNTVLIVSSLQNQLFLKIYTLSEEALYTFVRHLLGNINGCTVIPKSIYPRAIRDFGGAERRRELLEEFRGNMLSEVSKGLLYCTSSEVKEICRKKLTHQELKTDFTFLQVASLLSS